GCGPQVHHRSPEGAQGLTTGRNDRDHDALSSARKSILRRSPCGVFERLFENLRFQRLLAQEPMKFANTRFLRDAKDAAPGGADDGGEDPRAALRRTRENGIAAAEEERAEGAAERGERGLSEPMADLQAAQARVDELEAELARLRGEEPRALPSPESERTITSDEADI